jgi:hypothetical protein
MQAQPIYDNSSERLPINEVNFGVNRILTEHISGIREEMQDIKNTIDAMIKAKRYKSVEDWAMNLAVNSNAIGNITGFNSGQSLEETSKAYIKSGVSEKSKLKDITEFGALSDTGNFGDLKSFDPEENDQFLDEIVDDLIFDIEPQSLQHTENPMLVEAQIQVEKYALENPISDNRFSADDSQFALAS